MSRSRFVVAAVLISVGLTLLLYWEVLALPFYSDDLLQIPWVEQTSSSVFWTTAGPYRDYRPLHFTIWRSLGLMAGGLKPLLLHALNMLGHAVCGTLVAALASRLSGERRPAALLAGALFVVFPFASDAVPWAIAFSYPLAVSLGLGALLSYVSARESVSLRWHLLALLLTGLAGFAYEGGAVAGAVILLADVIAQDRRISPWALAHLGVSAAAFAAGALARPQGTAFPGLAGAELIPSSAFALQALVFPVAPVAGLAGRAGFSPVGSVLLLGLPALVLIAWIVHRSGGRGLLLISLGWFCLWAAPPLATLRFDWLTDAPRVFYPAAVGAALLWSAAADSWRGQWRGVALVVTVVLYLAPASWFVAGRMALYRQTGDLLWQVVDSAAGDTPLLVVNLPSRITPPDRFYPLGYEGVIPLPPEVGADDIVTAHLGGQGRALDRSAGAILPELPYSVRLLGDALTASDLREAGSVAIVEYAPAGMYLEQGGAILQTQDPILSQASFGAQIDLLSADCIWDGAGRVTLSARWRIDVPLEGALTVFAHLLGADGSLVAQADGPALRGLYPISWWQLGETIYDVRTFDASVPPARVVLGVWDPSTGTRWEAVGPDGRLPDDAFSCPVE